MYGIIGFPLTHSFSPAYFKEKFQRDGITEIYRMFPLKHIEAFPDLFQKHPDIKGLNVTIPYKESVIPFLDKLDETATNVAAVNCIKIASGKRTGFNTDVFGFTESLKPLLKKQHQKALILGTGGAAKAVAYALKRLGIDYKFVSRKKNSNQLNYADLSAEIIETHTLIINATPLGMFPRTDLFPDIPWSFLSRNHLLYDLIYNPERTLFLQKGKEQGAAIKNGYEMLVRQAEASWRIWNE